jgi:hypothetical protein
VNVKHTPEFLRKRYADRRKRGVCVDCETKVMDRARCEDCREKNRGYQQAYELRKPEVSAARMKRLYWQNPKHFRAQASRRRTEKKIRGECLKCPALAADGSNHCAKHIASESERQRVRRARKAAGLPPRKGGRPPGTLRKVHEDVLLGAMCECGQPRAMDAEACPRCSYLDGTDAIDSVARVIDALRDSNAGMSLRELCVALDMDDGLTNGCRSMWRWIQSLMSDGRIRRYWREDSQTTGPTMRSYRNGQTLRENAVGCWVYVLAGKTEREWGRAA